MEQTLRGQFFAIFLKVTWSQNAFHFGSNLKKNKNKISTNMSTIHLDAQDGDLAYISF